MEIRELNLKNYGKFKNHTITLRPGINIIYGGNEAGKSTIHSFIRAMFFGLNRGRGKAARTDEYQLRQPWETPGLYQGSMTITEDGDVYRIERCFDHSTEPIRMYCENRKMEVKQPEEALSLLMGEISEGTFVNTVFIPQAQCETDEALAQELRRFMINSDNALDGKIDVSQALQELRKKKKLCEQKKKKEDVQTESEIEKLQFRAEQVRSELEVLRAQTGQSKERKAGEEYRQSRYEDTQYIRLPENDCEDREYEDLSSAKAGSAMKWKLALELLLLLAVGVTLAGALLLTEHTLKLFLGVFSGIFAFMMLPVHFMIKEEKTDGAGPDPSDQAETKEENYLQIRIRKLEEEYKKLQDELEKLYHSHVKLDGIDAEIAALSMAIDHICSVSSDIYEHSGGRLNERASEILAQLTDGVYHQIRLDETGEVQICTETQVLRLYQVSGGTMQQIYFALRMAAGEILSENRNLPIILDETFAMYDEKRLEAALRWLRSSKRQVILFTCQRRELDLMKKINAE